MLADLDSEDVTMRTLPRRSSATAEHDQLVVLLRRRALRGDVCRQPQRQQCHVRTWRPRRLEPPRSRQNLRGGVGTPLRPGIRFSAHACVAGTLVSRTRFHHIDPFGKLGVPLRVALCWRDLSDLVVGGIRARNPIGRRYAAGQRRRATAPLVAYNRTGRSMKAAFTEPNPAARRPAPATRACH